MRLEPWQQLDKPFHSALARKPDECAGFLDAAGDEGLRKESKRKSGCSSLLKSNRFRTGGADGTRTRDLRRDRPAF
jgi:hypothetical protein